MVGCADGVGAADGAVVAVAVAAAGTGGGGEGEFGEVVEVVEAVEELEVEGGGGLAVDWFGHFLLSLFFVVVVGSYVGR